MRALRQFPAGKPSALLLVLGSVGSRIRVLGAMALLFAKGTAPTSPGYATPADAFAAHRKAEVERDWRAYLFTFAPESRLRVVGDLAVRAAFAAHRVPKLSDILVKHGAAESLWQGKVFAVRSEAQQRETLTDAIDDKLTFFVERRVQMEESFTERREALYSRTAAEFLKRREEDRRVRAAAKLGDVQIEGDMAKTTFSYNLRGSPVEHTVHFRQVNGQWYIYEPPPEEYSKQIQPSRSNTSSATHGPAIFANR